MDTFENSVQCNCVDNNDTEQFRIENWTITCIWLVYSHSWCLVWSCTGAIVTIMWFVVTFGFVLSVI